MWLVQGFFVPYLTGAIVLVVLAVGSTAPGLLQFVIGRFAQVFPDYRERVLRHEAAHFLVRTLNIGYDAAHLTFGCREICGMLNVTLNGQTFFGRQGT